MQSQSSLRGIFTRRQTSQEANNARSSPRRYTQLLFPPGGAEDGQVDSLVHDNENFMMDLEGQDRQNGNDDLLSESQKY